MQLHFSYRKITFFLLCPCPNCRLYRMVWFHFSSGEISFSFKRLDFDRVLSFACSHIDFFFFNTCCTIFLFCSFSKLSSLKCLFFLLPNASSNNEVKITIDEVTSRLSKRGGAFIILNSETNFLQIKSGFVAFFLSNFLWDLNQQIRQGRKFLITNWCRVVHNFAFFIVDFFGFLVAQEENDSAEEEYRSSPA